MNDWENQESAGGAPDDNSPSGAGEQNPYNQNPAASSYPPPYQQNPQQGYQAPPYGQQPYQGGYRQQQPPVYTSPAQAPKQPRGGKGMSSGKRLFIALLCVVVVLGGIGIGVSFFHKDGGAGNSDGPSLHLNDTPTVNTNELSTGEVLTPEQIYQKVSPSVVGVIVVTNSGFGEGSGVIMGEDSSGKYTYIITCAHVISGAKQVEIQMADGTTYSAEVVGSDSRTDIGVIRVRQTGFQAAEFGSSDSLTVGGTVYALGNPGGTTYYGTFTNGMVSGINRPVNSSVGYTMTCIQHTAAINPGNSGGALINAYGQVIGINSSKIADTDYEGMGFAVPSSTVKEVADSLIAEGYVSGRPMLGIRYKSVYSDSTYGMIAQIKGLPKGSLVIYSINENSAFTNTQVQQGDIITKVNGKDLESDNSLSKFIEKSKVGDEVTLTICRVGSDYQISEFDVKVTLIEDKGTNTVEESSSNQSIFPFNR